MVQLSRGFAQVLPHGVAGAPGQDKDEEDRNEEHGQQRCRDHSANTRCRSRAASPRWRRWPASGQDAQCEGQEVIRMGRKRSRGGLHGGVDQGHALLAQLSGELDDQDGVLGPTGR